MTGVCFRCGRHGAVQLDHPTGRHRGAPLHPHFTIPACPRCHKEKGRVDRAAAVEGGDPTLLLVVARLAAWFGWLALPAIPVAFAAADLELVAWVLEELARQLPGDLPWKAAR